MKTESDTLPVSIPDTTPPVVKESVEKLEYTDCIYFDFDKSNIRFDQFGNIADMEKFIKDNKAKFMLYGHTDTIGTVKYNHDLGFKRCEAVNKALGMNLPIKSFGEMNPVLNCSKYDEFCHANNRRVELIVK